MNKQKKGFEVGRRQRAWTDRLTQHLMPRTHQPMNSVARQLSGVHPKLAQKNPQNSGFKHYFCDRPH